MRTPSHLFFGLIFLCACPSKPEAEGTGAHTSSPNYAGPNTGASTASALPPKAAASPKLEAAATSDLGKLKFIRTRPDNEQRKGLDACAYLGGFGFGCLEALLAEKNPVFKRYMRRMSDADARQAWDQLQRNEPGGVAHAEFAISCADSGPCAASQDKNDDGYACLTRAEAAIQQKEAKEAKAAHERACMCGAERAQIPVMGGFLACDGAKPVERGKNMSSEEAAEVRACAECDELKGPTACAKEVARLSKSDAELAKYIETVHAIRCTKP